MIGHSFGGFTSSHFCSKYPQHVKKLLLLSPCGIKVPRPEQLVPGYDPTPEMKERAEKHKQLGDKLSNRKQPSSFTQYLVARSWKKKQSASKFVHKIPKSWVRKGIKKHVSKNKNIETEEEGEAVRDYMYQVLMRNCYTDTAIIQVFNLGMICKLPVGAADKLGSPTCPIGVSFVYGDADPVRGMEEDGP